MAMKHGKTGSVTLPGIATLKIRSWTVDATADVAEVTAMNDSWKEYLAGVKDWTATVELLWDSTIDATDLGILGTEIACDFDMSSGGADFGGDGIVTGMSFSTPADDAITVTVNIQGTGALA